MVDGIRRGRVRYNTQMTGWMLDVEVGAEVEVEVVVKEWFSALAGFVVVMVVCMEEWSRTAVAPDVD